MRAASRPPLHDSARPRRCPCSSRRHLRVDRLPLEAEEVALVALGEASPHRFGRRRRLVAVADVDLDLAAAQAGGDLDLRQGDALRLHLAQALGDLGLGDAEHAQRVAVQRRGPLQQLRTGSVSSAAGHIGCSSRGGPGRTTTRRPSAGTTRPGAVPTGIERDRALGHHRLLAVGLPHRLGVKVEAAGEAAQDRRDLLLHLLVEDQVAAGEPGDDLGGEVVGGRAEAARGDDQVHPLGGHEAQRRLEVVGPVADDEDVGDVDAQLRQLFGEPRPVAVGDPAGQDLGPGYHYPCAHLSRPRTRERIPVHI